MSRPERDTPEWKLWVAAIDVAIYPPLEANATAYAAKVPWFIIGELRDALDALGVDWRAAKVDNDERLNEAGKRVAERRRLANIAEQETAQA